MFNMFRYMGHTPYGYGFGPLSFIGPIMMILFWVIVITLIFLAVRALSRRHGYVTNTEPQVQPLEILKVRYAKGELTKEQYDGMRQDLS